MSESVALAHDESTVNLACFESKGQVYAIDVVHIREIVRAMDVTPLPNAPSLIEGVIDLRSAVIPVVDLARVLNRGEAIEGSNARIVVLEIDGLVLGLRVDAATDVMTLSARRLEDVPDLATHAGYDAVRHVVRREHDSPIMVLAPEAVIEHVYRSALPARTAGGATP